MKLNQMMLLIFILILLTLRCDLTDLPVNTSFVLTLEDVSCTEAWIKVSGVTGSEIQLNRNDKEVQKFILTSSPQTIVDDSLLPKTNYIYQAVRNGEESNTINVTTMDTTSHNFTWQTFTFGEHSSSILYDLAIINENNIWAVGEIYLNDSTGQTDPQPYNLAIWDGQIWGLQKLLYKGFPPVIKSIFAVNEQNVWLDPWFHWDGQGFQEITIDPVFYGIGINKIWGNSNGIYVVGNNGFIAYRSDNGGWQKIESGTTMDIHDIYGAYNYKTQQWEILAVASSDLDKKLLTIKGTDVSPVPDSGLSNSLYGIWFAPNKKYYIVGAGIHYKNLADNSVWHSYASGVVTSYLSGGVRGNDVNDVFVAGSFLEIVHFNGSSWYNYQEVIPHASGAVGRMAVKGNLFVTVGWSGQSALIIIGRR